ncbi:VWA domain-containing protein [Mesorhizobium sp. M0213]|uniref:VWA domain-containing protein n=1 Tax=unclassified Mesorhizobium TaxID=325217 RepID=UPI003334E72F
MDDEAEATQTGAPSPDGGRERRWRLAIGADDETSAALSSDDKRLSAALDALYGDGANAAADPRKRRGGLGRSAPRVAQWMGDIRSFFPAQVVQIVQKDAFERLNLKQMLMEPEFLKAIEADVNLVADLVSLRSVMPAKTKDIARAIIADIVAKLMQRLEQKTVEAIRGALDRSRRTNRPRSRDIDWQRTISANLRHYQPEHKTIVPEKLVGFIRKQRRLVDLDEVVLCVDQSGSMASSVIYASIFAAVMASLPVVRTKLVCFDTAIVDLTEELSDPVEVLFGVQLGGGTDINQAVAYCADRIERPTKSHLVLITDLFEGGNGQELLRRLAALVRSGVNVVVLLALTDQGRPGYDPAMAGSVAALGIPVFACTPDLFPDMMAAALRREDIGAWAAGADIKLIRAEAEAPGMHE